MSFLLLGQHPVSKPPVAALSCKQKPRRLKKTGGVRYRSGRSHHWVKCKNPAAPAVKREAEEDWSKERWR